MERRWWLVYSLDALPHASGVRAVLEVLLDPLLVAVLSLIDALLQVGPG